MSLEVSPSASVPAPVDTAAPRLRVLLQTALDSAREAVVLDEAQKAREALGQYSESVRLLREVLARVRAEGGQEVARREVARVQAILDTYTSRISILRQIYRIPAPTFDGEAQ
ncbi:hypothetical protein LshimejAT787_0700440 [Lyophyllum shimeji]|uniref:MIT domain-containing protein n=1 Tax=Lyophyllum shimeji TaxID=47721 RepID=A0A9P3ULP9_LYOSH|nr:hypothetical protein LshimejAT787_0700440 [Lyophyllum shimeji]